MLCIKVSLREISLFVCGLCVIRQPTQDAPEEVRARDFRRELEERERVAVREKTRERGPRGECSTGRWWWPDASAAYFISFHRN